MTWEFGTDAWRIVLPHGVTTRHHVTPPPDTDLTSMAIARGWLSDTAPATIIVSTRPRTNRTLRKLSRHLATNCDEDLGDGEEVDVAGARGARRLDGRYLMEEGVSPDGVEHMTVIVAAGGKEMVVLTIRTPYSDPVLNVVESIVASFEVRGA